jgi:nicotinate-nucleotide pyrophosphorylase (carboxylating)
MSTSCTDTDFSALLPPTAFSCIEGWIHDDMPTTDVGGFVVGDKEETADLWCKSSCIVAGKAYAQAVFDFFGLDVKWECVDGQKVEVSGGKIAIATVSGPCRKVLMAERTALNILSRASGVATVSRAGVEIGKANGWKGSLAGTRKTTPGFRAVEKYGLVVGGAATHRQDLSQMVMLKDNHIWSTGSITAAVHKARYAAGFSMKIEVECQTLEEALEAASAGADIVMLDNFTANTIHECARSVKDQFPSVLIEASGGITDETMHLFMSDSVDIISRGNLTQGYPCMDFSLKIRKN